MTSLLKENRNYNYGSNFVLSDDQVTSVEFLLRRVNGAILGLAPGFGKTLVSLCAAERCLEMSAKPLEVVVLCPKSALNSFKKELETRIQKPYSIYTTQVYKVVPNAQYHIFSLSKLDYLEEFLKTNHSTKLLIFDEVHVMSTKSKRNDLLKTLRQYFKIVWGLTGTPLIDKLEGLYPTINFVRPGYLGTKTSFEARYFKTKLVDIYTKQGKIKKREIVGAKNLDELKEILDKIVITKTKNYNVLFHTRKTRLSNDEFDLYRQLAKGLDDDRIEPKEFSSRLIDLQYCVNGSHPDHIPQGTSSKEKLLLKTIQEITNRNEAMLIYCEYQNDYNRIASILDKYKYLTNHVNIYYINGSIDFKDRVMVENNISPRDIVLLSKAGSASINLQKANNIIVYDTPFSSGTLIQLIGRICRTDTTFNQQNIYFLLVEGTIDVYRYKVCENKLNYITQLFGGAENLPPIKDEEIDTKKLKRELLWYIKNY